MDLANPWRDAGEVTRRLFFLVSIMSAKRAKMGRFTPKYPELDEQVMEWFSQVRDQIFHL